CRSGQRQAEQVNRGGKLEPVAKLVGAASPRHRGPARLAGPTPRVAIEGPLMHFPNSARIALPMLLCLALCGSPGPVAAVAQEPDRRLQEAEAQRIAVIAKLKPSVVAIFGHGGQGGGSGVLISKDGYALTNFHVVQGAGPVMQCGLPDGIFYDAVQV